MGRLYLYIFILKAGMLFSCQSHEETTETDSKNKPVVNEVHLQVQGYGVIPKNTEKSDPSVNRQQFMKYYGNYWKYWPGVPVQKK